MSTSLNRIFCCFSFVCCREGGIFADIVGMLFQLSAAGALWYAFARFYGYVLGSAPAPGHDQLCKTLTKWTLFTVMTSICFLYVGLVAIVWIGYVREFYSTVFL